MNGRRSAARGTPIRPAQHHAGHSHWRGHGRIGRIPRPANRSGRVRSSPGRILRPATTASCLQSSSTDSISGFDVVMLFCTPQAPPRACCSSRVLKIAFVHGTYRHRSKAEADSNREHRSTFNGLLDPDAYDHHRSAGLPVQCRNVRVPRFSSLMRRYSSPPHPTESYSDTTARLSRRGVPV